jgi:hypothetical protein
VTLFGDAGLGKLRLPESRAIEETLQKMATVAVAWF